jgi:hypothetical protein
MKEHTFTVQWVKQEDEEGEWVASCDDCPDLIWGDDSPEEAIKGIINLVSQADIDKECGLYDKYIVKRTDGSSEPGEKHESCEYFVLDLDHDKFALAALVVYAKACNNDYPILAKDLEEIIKRKHKIE